MAARCTWHRSGDVKGAVGVSETREGRLPLLNEHAEPAMHSRRLIVTCRVGRLRPRERDSPKARTPRRSIRFHRWALGRCVVGCSGRLSSCPRPTALDFDFERELRNVLITTIPARTPTLWNVGSTATVLMMSPATRNSAEWPDRGGAGTPGRPCPGPAMPNVPGTVPSPLMHRSESTGRRRARRHE